MPGGQQEAGNGVGAAQSWRAVLDLAGAAAGIVVLVGLVGSAIMWARLHALDLPAGRGISLLSNESVLSLGAVTLLGAMLVGVIAIGLLHAMRWALPPQAKQAASYILVLALELLLLFAVFEVALTGPQRVIVVVTGLLAGGLFTAIAASTQSFRREALAAFFLVAAVGGVLSFARDLGAPVKLEPAVILLKDGSLTSGAYIATADGDVYVAPDLFNRTYGQLAAIPRADIARISLSEPRDFRSAGAEDARPLFAGASSDSEHVRGVERYLAQWAADPLWKYPPASFLESQAFLRSNLSEFVPDRPQPWKRDGTPVSLDRLVQSPRTYSGRAVITIGRLRQIIEPPGQSGPTVTRFLLLEAGRQRDSVAICAVATDAQQRYPEAGRIEARGVVVSAGTVVRRAQEGAKGVFMQCSAARPVAARARRRS